jgi:hypothetical protein
MLNRVNGQGLKLLMLLNACFWLTLLFLVSRLGRALDPALVSSITVLGILAFAANLAYLIVLVASSSRQRPFNNLVPRLFILFTFMAQVALGVYYYLWFKT